MKSKLPWILLGISLCFNVFFVSGYLSARRIPKLLATPAGWTQIVSDRLGLDDRQRQELVAVNARREAQMQEVRSPYAKGYEAFWGEVLKDEPDRKRIAEIQQESAVLHGQMARIRTEFLLDTVKLMTPEQRTRYARMVRGRSIFAE